MIHTITNTYIMVLTSLGGIDTVKYMRTTILVPNNSAKDDGMSLKTENAPVSFSIILSYSELDENPVFAKYDQVQNDVKRKQEQNIVLDELELEFVNGQYEFQGYGYIGYGKWLFEQNRYYDTFSILERAFNFIRMKNLDTQNQELMSAYYDICNIMGQCLSKMDREDEASYFFKQGAPAFSLDKPNFLALSYAKLGNPTAVARMNDWLVLSLQNYKNYENLPEDLKQFTVDVPVELSKYKKNADELLQSHPNYNNHVTIGLLLKTFMGINEKNVAPCMIIYDCSNRKFLDKIEDTQGILNFELDNTEQQNRIFVLSCLLP